MGKFSEKNKQVVFLNAQYSFSEIYDEILLVLLLFMSSPLHYHILGGRTLFRSKRFMLDEMFQQNASMFAIDQSIY